MKQVDKSGLVPFAVEFYNGHYSVLQCKNETHLRERCKVEYPKLVIATVIKL